MTVDTDTEYAQHEVETVRSQCDLIQANIKALGQFLPEKMIRDAISEWRLCVTTARKHYPKAPVLFAEMERFDLNALLSIIITHPPSHQDLKDYIVRFHDLLLFPKTYFDNYDDMFPKLDDEGKPMMRELEYRDFLLAEAHREAETYPEHIINDEQPYVDMAGKKFKKAYKKYVEEWKEKYD